MISPCEHLSTVIFICSQCTRFNSPTVPLSLSSSSHLHTCSKENYRRQNKVYFFLQLSYAHLHFQKITGHWCFYSMCLKTLWFQSILPTLHRSKAKMLTVSIPSHWTAFNLASQQRYSRCTQRSSSIHPSINVPLHPIVTSHYSGRHVVMP